MPNIIAGKYEVLETIGRGGMGSVYKAHQRNLDRVVAVKMLSEELASDDEFRARFQQEATIVARLSHPNIVAVHDIEPHNHTFCIIMEYLEGETLQAKIDRDIMISEREALSIGAQVARALHYAHTNGIIHRDIKPDNIHISPQGVAKVMDFGIARFRESKLKTQTGISMGTPKFMSPEQVTGKGVDGQTDLYSLGVCLYTALAGRVPFDGENAIAIATRHLYEPPEPPSRHNPAITPAAEKVILRALEKSKADRYKTGNELAAALEQALNARTPIRLGEESNYRQAVANATERMVVSPVHGVRLNDATAGAPGTQLADAEAAVAVADATPLGVRQPREVEFPDNHPDEQSTPGKKASLYATPERLPALDDNFSYTRPRSTTDEPRKISSAARWLIAAIVLFAATFAIVWYTVPGLRGGGMDPNSNAGTDDPMHNSAAGREYRDLQERTRKLTAEGNIAEALKQWAQFAERQEAFAGKQPMVQQTIDRLESSLPLSSGKAQLAARRRRKGLEFSALGDARHALAVAYLQAAIDLGESGFIVGSLNQLRNYTPTADSEASKKALEDAEKLVGGNRSKAEERLQDAVSLDPSNFAAWRRLGDFYRQQGLFDDARVIYQAAKPHASADEAAQIDKDLQAIENPIF